MALPALTSLNPAIVGSAGTDKSDEGSASTLPRISSLIPESPTLQVIGGTTISASNEIVISGTTNSDLPIVTVSDGKTSTLSNAAVEITVISSKTFTLTGSETTAVEGAAVRPSKNTVLGGTTISADENTILGGTTTTIGEKTVLGGTTITAGEDTMIGGSTIRAGKNTVVGGSTTTISEKTVVGGTTISAERETLSRGQTLTSSAESASSETDSVNANAPEKDASSAEGILIGKPSATMTTVPGAIMVKVSTGGMNKGLRGSVLVLIITGAVVNLV